MWKENLIYHLKMTPPVAKTLSVYLSLLAVVVPLLLSYIKAQSHQKAAQQSSSSIVAGKLMG